MSDSVLTSKFPFVQAPKSQPSQANILLVGSLIEAQRRRYVRYLQKPTFSEDRRNVCVDRGLKTIAAHANSFKTQPTTVPSNAHINQTDLGSTSRLSAWQSVARERWEGELVVDGQIPLWLNGTYLRNGPGMFHVGEHEFRHLFDGYATLVRLHFEKGRVIAGHAQIESEAYKAAKENDRLCYREFSEVPKQSNFFSYFGELAGLFSGASLTDNANTGVIRLGDGRIVCLTETMKGSIQINPKTLETIGKFNYSDNLKGLIHSAHPYVSDKELITLIPDLISPGYKVVRMLPGSNERTLIGRVNCRGGPAPGWVHSFAVTENYVIVPEMSLRYCVKNLLKAEPTPLYKFEWRPESGAFVHVMSKSTGKIVASVEVPLFVTFHFINAYEEKGSDGEPMTVIADCCEHCADTSILNKLKLQELRSFSGVNVLPDARVGRFVIPLDGSPRGNLEDALPSNEHGRGMDMCTINPQHTGKRYRYAYACGARRPCNFPNTLTKIDLEEKCATNWYEEGAIPSEPFFVPRSGGELEDDGVVISLVSDRHGGGFAVILDGTTFTEIARAKLPYGLPYGLHGCWIPAGDK